MCSGIRRDLGSVGIGGMRAARAVHPGAARRYERAVTASPAAARAFNDGLLRACAFNHEDALRCFARAAEIDPSCAMAHWGLAYCNRA